MSNARTFCNSIRTTLISRAKKAVGKVKKTAETNIRTAIRDYYKDYKPKEYVRTNTLANALTVSAVEQVGDCIQATITIVDSIKYNTGSSWWNVGHTVKAADQLTHGYYKAGSGVSVWEEPWARMDANSNYIWQLALAYAGLK